ncbi:bifunctional metallophosphatase/5'-nucleotidase [Planctomicrobium sp. SH668]|uniref:bifunctional metallophosphatase/5'-nucleotidase n=1 Tax=Planctomicrobium sp. SH668 TaxID=3448126 RepID=UPI003F5CB690
MNLSRREFHATTLSLLGAQLIPAAFASASPPPSKSLTLLHFTDTHAQLETHLDYVPDQIPAFQQMGGFARLKTAIDLEKGNAAGPVFIADGGDEFQGSGPAAWTEGEAIVAPLNALGADVFVPGNWEPVYGPKRFKELMSRLTAKVTCYNFHDKATQQRLFLPAAIIERNGVKVAFVGVTDLKASERHAPAEYAGLDTTNFVGFREYLAELRTKERVDLVVGLFHTGLTVARYLAREVPGFDVILSGHTHERTPEPILEGNVIIVESAGMGSFLGRLDITLSDSGKVSGAKFQLIPVTPDAHEENPHVRQLVNDALAPHRARTDRVIGHTVTPMMRYDVLETNADDFITDAIRESTGVDIAFSNGFRFGIPIPAGNLTVGDVWNLLPMEARVKTGWVTGKQLRNYLENELELVYSSDAEKLSGGWGPRASGMTMWYEARAAKGSRMREILVAGQPLDDDRKYSVASCERRGEPLEVVCRIKGVKDVEFSPTLLHAAIEKYLQKHPSISPSREGRAYAIDLAPVVFSQDEVVSNGGSRGSFAG